MNYIIEGGTPLKGEITPTPNKNSVVAIIPAIILADEPVILTNVPKSSSVRTLLRIFKSLGGKVSYLKGSKIKLDPRPLNGHVIDKELAKKERSANMFLGPLLARFGKAELGEVGGCKLGQRPIDTLMQGLLKMGAEMDPENIFKLSAKEIVGNPDIWQLEASVTGTENLIMTAVKAKGTTVIYNAACEPHVQDLCNFLVSLGGRIYGIGTNKLQIQGVDRLTGGQWEIIPDHIDIGGLIVASAITRGEVTIKNAIPHHMQHVLQFFEKLNLHCDVVGQDIKVPGDQDLYCKSNMKGDIDKIVAQPWPTGFPVDLLPQALVLAASLPGNMIIMNPMYERGLTFVDDLVMMKGNVILADPGRAITYGPSDWKGATLSAPAIIQCAHALALVGFAARGTTKILNADIISRRFPEFTSAMTSLGGRIYEE